MPNLNIEVKNKIAIGDNTKIVCDNSDYIVNFNLDQEWDNFSTKTMRVRYSNNEYTDYVFNGTSCKLPVITDKSAIEIGLYAGNLHTTSGAAYECIGSILGGAGTQVEPAQNIYNQIIQLLDDLNWSTLPNKPFETIGTGLEVNDQGVLFNTGAGGSFNIHELSEAKVISNDDEIPVYMVAENRTKKILWETIEAQLKTSFDSFYAAIKHKHTVNDITDFPTIPTKTSDLENDSGFITSLDVPAVLYTEQVLTPDQRAQARTNIGAGQPVFAVNVTKVSEGEGYTADKTAAEIEAAYQAGRTIVCKTQARFMGGQISAELPLVSRNSRNQERVFTFAVDQLVRNGIFTVVVDISDSGVEVSNNMVEIYKQPVGGIPKSDLADDVQTSLAKADTAISLGLTAATPGQIIKVKTVQDGKPTEWEAVDMPSAGVGWYEVIDMETAENVNDLTITTDKNGRPISGYHALAMVLCFKVPADSTQTSTNGAIWVYPVVNNYLAGALRIIANVSTWKTITRDFNYFYAGSNRAIFVSGAPAAVTFSDDYNDIFNGIRLFVNNANDHLPTGTKIRCLVLSKGWMA